MKVMEKRERKELGRGGGGGGFPAHHPPIPSFHNGCTLSDLEREVGKECSQRRAEGAQEVGRGVARGGLRVLRRWAGG